MVFVIYRSINEEKQTDSYHASINAGKPHIHAGSIFGLAEKVYESIKYGYGDVAPLLVSQDDYEKNKCQLPTDDTLEFDFLTSDEIIGFKDDLEEYLHNDMSRLNKALKIIRGEDE